MITEVRNLVNRYNKIFMITMFLIFSILSVAFLIYFKHSYNSQYFIYHYSNIKSIENDLIYPSIDHSTGPILSFTPLIVLLQFLLKSLFISNSIVIFYSMIGLIIFITYITSYFGFKVYENVNINAFIYCVLYTNSSLLFNWNFYSGDISLTLAMAFLPLAFFGMISFIKNGKHLLLFTIGIIFTLSTQLVIGGLAFVFLIIFLLLYSNNITHENWYKFLFSVLSIIVVTSIFWYPTIKLAAIDNINLLGSFDYVAGKPYMYTGHIANYVYSITEVIGFLSILLFKSKKYDKFAIGCWLIGIISLLLIKIPIIINFQLSLHLIIVTHLLLTFLATNLLIGRYNDIFVVNKSLTYLIIGFYLFEPFINELSFILH